MSDFARGWGEIPRPTHQKYAASIEEITHAQCWAHTRRKFIEAERVEAHLSKQAVDTIGKLYQHEAEIRERGLTGRAKRAYRKAHGRPLVDAFFVCRAAGKTFQPLSQPLFIVRNNFFL